MDYDWKTWSPGDSDAATIASKSGWLNAGLLAQEVTIEGSNEVDLDVLGKIVSEELRLGSGEAVITKRITSEMGIQKSLAKSLGHFASALASSQSSMADFLDTGVEDVEWLAGNCCNLCDDNENTNVEIGKKFKSGHRFPPSCAYCICAISPFIVY